VRGKHEDRSAKPRLFRRNPSVRRYGAEHHAAAQRRQAATPIRRRQEIRRNRAVSLQPPTLQTGHRIHIACPLERLSALWVYSKKSRPKARQILSLEQGRNERGRKRYRCIGAQDLGAGQMTQEVFMDWDRVEGNWKQVKGRVKEKWGNLTDDDLDRVAGSRDQLEGIIQERYGIAKDQVRKDIDTWLSSQRM